MWILLLCSLLGISNAQDLLGWSITRDACLNALEATWTTGVLSESDCQQLCRDTTDFVCKGVAYNPGQQRCIFYDVSSDDVLIESPCSLAGTDLLEPLALFSWNNVAQGCLVVTPDDTFQTDFISVCFEKCLESNTFQCNSFTYHNKTCLMSSSNSQTAAMVSPCDPNDTDYVYYERTRSPEWKLFKDTSNGSPTGSIRTQAASSMFDCLIHCEQETSVTCKGALYEHTTGNCYLRSVNATETTLSASSSRHFFERVDRSRWRTTTDGCAQADTLQEAVSGLSVEGCYARCEATYTPVASYTCSSVNYVASTRTCELSTFTINDEPSYLATPCQSGGYSFHEKLCTVGA